MSFAPHSGNKSALSQMPGPSRIATSPARSVDGSIPAGDKNLRRDVEWEIQRRHELTAIGRDASRQKRGVLSPPREWDFATKSKLRRE